MNIAFHLGLVFPSSLRSLCSLCVGVYPERVGPLSFSFSRPVACELSTANFHPSVLDFKLSTFNLFSPTPFPATVAHHVNHNPFVCHSCRKHPEWGIPSCSVNSVNSVLRAAQASFPIDRFRAVRSMPASPLESAFAGHPANAHSKGLTQSVSPLYPTFTKKRGGGRQSCQAPVLHGHHGAYPCREGRMTFPSIQLLNVELLNPRRPQAASCRPSVSARDTEHEFKMIGCCRTP